jgi:hypothetical protein
VAAATHCRHGEISRVRLLLRLLSTGDAEEAAVIHALHERAAETIVLASSEKLVAASPFVVASLQDLSLLVVPPKTPDRTIRACGPEASKFRNPNSIARSALNVCFPRHCAHNSFNLTALRVHRHIRLQPVSETARRDTALGAALKSFLKERGELS